MKYLKNIHEHKNNISVVSKKFKGIILGMIFVFGMSVTVDANVKSVGVASDCVRKAKAAIRNITDINDHDPNDYMALYMDLYLHCYYKNK